MNTHKTRILDVVYNASNNELVRTKTLVKNAIVQVDATPFRQWYEQHYGVKLHSKKKGGAAHEADAEVSITRCCAVAVHEPGFLDLTVIGLCFALLCFVCAG